MAGSGRPSLIVSLALVAAIAGVLAACGPSAPAADDGHAAGRTLLVRLAGLATQRVHQADPSATLQQIDIAPGDGRYVFRFADAGGSRVISATGDVGSTTAEALSTAIEPLTVLVAPPSAPIDLETLRMGPDGVVASAVEALSAASPRSLVLTRERGRLVWRAVVNGPKGIVSGSVPDDTGRFLADAP